MLVWFSKQVNRALNVKPETPRGACGICHVSGTGRRGLIKTDVAGGVRWQPSLKKWAIVQPGPRQRGTARWQTRPDIEENVRR